MKAYGNKVILEMLKDDLMSDVKEGKIVSLGHLATSEKDPLKVGDIVLLTSGCIGRKVTYGGNKYTIVTRLNIDAIM